MARYPRRTDIDAALLTLSEKGVFPLGWSWLVILGTAGTYGLAWVLGPILDGEAPRQEGAQAP